MSTIAYCIATGGYTPVEIARRQQLIDTLVPREIRIEPVVIPAGPQFLDRATDFDTAIKAAADFATTIDPAKYDIVISAGAIDPGLAGLRARAPLPVVGPGESSMFFASAWGMPLSVVTVDEHAVANTHKMLGLLKAKPPIASVRSLDMPVRRIVQDLDAAKEAVRREARLAVEKDGARAIYLGAMTLGTLGLDEELRRDLRVAVFNPIRCALTVAVACVQQRALS